MSDKVKLYPAAIGPIRLTERDKLIIWSPVEISRHGEYGHAIYIEFLWRWKLPHTGKYTNVKFAQFGPFDFRRLPKWRKSPPDTETLTDGPQMIFKVETG
jgi:hypothetical protein